MELVLLFQNEANKNTSFLFKHSNLVQKLQPRVVCTQYFVVFYHDTTLIQFKVKVMNRNGIDVLHHAKYRTV
jgi:hypothetical protein